MRTRPNILLITSDQQRGDCYGFAGRKVRTPHLDRMAGRGTRFSACIAPNAVCQPARASILTGLLPRTNGVWDNGVELRPEIGEAGFAGQLGRLGYRTGFIGKSHFATHNTFLATGTPECKHTAHSEDWYGPYMGFEHVELTSAGHLYFNDIRPPILPPYGQHYERFFHGGGRSEWLVRAQMSKGRPDVGAEQTWHSQLPPAFHTSTWCADRTIRLLERYREQPFCIWSSFPDPHHPFDAPEPWSRLHHPDEVDLPAHRTLDLERRPWWHRASLEGIPQLADEKMRAFRAKMSRVPPQTDVQLRHLIANYYGMIALIDHNVGRIFAALDDLGLSGNTLVVFTTDHGEWLGDHGLILKGPMMYEGLLRVGCIVNGPGVPAGKVVAEPVSTLDLAATFYDYAGAHGGDARHSRSLRPLIERQGGTRDFAHNEWDLHPSRCGVALKLRTVRTRTHKLTLELDSGAGELYDLVNDPEEMENRYEDAAYRSVRRELEAMIRSRPDDALHPLAEPVGSA
ncbi:MAG: sulfatase-like hydrolase/transferase [Candidatus Lambdaproteobacteria bacterium]|nr:sulfatase-like hydrolase/transferase [Candidatus Lambdaproteobacteria bacterium]